jgi:hypothetical protein
MRANFIDFNAIVSILDIGVRIVDKNDPDHVLSKIDLSDFEILKSGVFRGSNREINTHSGRYWASEEFYEKLKRICDRNKIYMQDIEFDLSEFDKKGVIDDKKIEIKYEIMSSISKEDDNYIILSSQNKRNFSTIINKFQLESNNFGFKIKKFFTISENLKTSDESEIREKKMSIIIDHLIGFEIKDGIMTNVSLPRYDQIHYYDSSRDVLDIGTNLNKFLEYTLSKSEKNIVEIVKDILEKKSPVLWIHKINDNELQKVTFLKVPLRISGMNERVMNWNQFTLNS